MEDFDIFTNEIDFAPPVHKNILNKYVYDVPNTPSGPNYESGRKLLGKECLAEGLENECAFHFSESASATFRILAMYREDLLKSADNGICKIKHYIQPVKNIVEKNPMSNDDEKVLDLFPNDVVDPKKILNKYNIDVEQPLYKKYMRYGSDNNVDNFMKILNELPKEWTIIQLTAPYNPNENLKSYENYCSEITSFYITLLSNKYFDSPVTIEVPANITKEGEKPLFEELHSVLQENFETINNAPMLNNKRLVQNYWSKRDYIDLRMKSVINTMYMEWLGGFSSLLTGRLLDEQLRHKIINLVDTTVADWGFIRLTKKQKVLLYNLIESSAMLSSHQIRSCIRKILIEHGNIDDIRNNLRQNCASCSTDFKNANELCLKCLMECFKAIHNFTLADAIKAFSKVASQVKEGDEWVSLKTAKRQPVILIVDEMLDTFPWETLPVFKNHAVTRIENIHILYVLFKVHQNKIINGYYTAKAEEGRYVVNPKKNLDRMERRMTSFLNFWCKSWKGYAGELPTEDNYLKYLTEADIFLYCGHGNGLHLAGASSQIESSSCGCVCVLSGCSSLRLARSGRRGSHAAPHHHLHIAGCPMVIGMLWEVTDLEVDKMVTTMLSHFVPSDACCDWKNVGKSKWSQGVIDLPSTKSSPLTFCQDVLLSVCQARAASNFVMIASSLVVRGIPVMIN